MPKNKKHGANWLSLLVHFILFASVHLLFGYIYGVIPLEQLGTDSYLSYVEEHFVNHGIDIYQNETVNTISDVWKSILIVHLIVELAATLFPEKEKEKKESNQPVDLKLHERSAKRTWAYLILAGILEVVWASALKLDMLAGPIVVVLVISFNLLIKAVKDLGVGTAYAVFTAIGSVGLVFVDLLLFNEQISAVKLLFIILLIICIAGLKLFTESPKEARQ